MKRIFAQMESEVRTVRLWKFCARELVIWNANRKVRKDAAHLRYRLVNVSELNAADMVPLTTGTVGPSTSEVKLIATPTRRKRVATMSVQGMSNGRGQLGDDLILDDGISEKTVTIDQSKPPYWLLNARISWRLIVFKK